jgi:transposase-like protein
MISWSTGARELMAAPKKYPDELRERAVRLVRESGRPIAHVAEDLGIHRKALRQWVRQDEADRDGEARARVRRDRVSNQLLAAKVEDGREVEPALGGREAADVPGRLESGHRCGELRRIRSGTAPPRRPVSSGFGACAG